MKSGCLSTCRSGSVWYVRSRGSTGCTYMQRACRHGGIIFGHKHSPLCLHLYTKYATEDGQIKNGIWDNGAYTKHPSIIPSDKRLPDTGLLGCRTVSTLSDSRSVHTVANVRLRMNYFVRGKSIDVVAVRTIARTGRSRPPLMPLSARAPSWGRP